MQLALLNHRNILRTGELRSPAQRLFSRRTRTHIPALPRTLRPAIVINVPEKILESRQQQKKYFDKGSQQQQTLKPGDKIRMIKNTKEWEFGTVVSEEEEPRSYKVKTNNGDLFRRNSRQLHITKANEDKTPKTMMTSEAEEETDGCIEARGPIESMAQWVANTTTTGSSDNQIGKDS